MFHTDHCVCVEVDRSRLKSLKDGTFFFAAKRQISDFGEFHLEFLDNLQQHGRLNCAIFCSVFLLPDEMYGDFEDLETGEVHSGQTAQKDQSEVESDLLPLTSRILTVCCSEIGAAALLLDAVASTFRSLCCILYLFYETFLH